jgi:hypothetical protein
MQYLGRNWKINIENWKNMKRVKFKKALTFKNKEIKHLKRQSFVRFSEETEERRRS